MPYLVFLKVQSICSIQILAGFVVFKYFFHPYYCHMAMSLQRFVVIKLRSAYHKTLLPSAAH